MLGSEGIWTDQDVPVEENEDNAQDEGTDVSQETGSQSQNSRAIAPLGPPLPQHQSQSIQVVVISISLNHGTNVLHLSDSFSTPGLEYAIPGHTRL